MMLLLGLAEMAGVASIFPLIAVLSNPSLVQSNAWLSFAYSTFGFTSLDSFFIFLSTGVFILIVFRTVLTALTSYAVLRYAQMRSHGLSVRLLGSYLRRPYAFFLNRHSADMGKTVLSEVEQVISGSLMPALQLVSQTIIAGFVIAVVVIIDPAVAVLSFIVVVGSYGLVYVSIRNYLKRKGIERIAANKERFRIAQEVLAGVKEVKISGLERGYIRRFDKASLRYSRLRSQLNLVREIPRHMLELVAIGGILSVILALLFRANGDLNAALPTMAVYAFAGLRLLPAIQTLYQAVVALRFGGPALDALWSDIFEADHATDLTPIEPLHLRGNIQLEDVHFAYPDVKRRTLQGISLSISACSTVALVGPTGSGKSTIVDIILGLLEPQAGCVKVDGIAITRENVRSWQRSVGYVPQQIFIADESVAANIALGVAPDKVDLEAVERAARLANLHDFIVAELPRGYMTEVGDRGLRLSGGQRQRLGIARALYADPDVLVLDEATSALDNLTEKLVMDTVKNMAKQKTIIMIAHRLSTVRDCDQIFFVKSGAIASASDYASLMEDEEFRRFSAMDQGVVNSAESGS